MELTTREQWLKEKSQHVISTQSLWTVKKLNNPECKKTYREFERELQPLLKSEVAANVLSMQVTEWLDAHFNICYLTGKGVNVFY